MPAWTNSFASPKTELAGQEEWLGSILVLESELWLHDILKERGGREARREVVDSHGPQYAQLSASCRLSAFA